MAHVLTKSEVIGSSSIARTVRYVDWTVLLAAGVVTTINGIGDVSALELYVTFGSLAICTLLSFSFPIDYPLWQRRTYITLGILALIPTRIFTSWNLEILLYLYIVKSCFLLKRKDVVILVVTMAIVWQLSLVWGFMPRWEQTAEQIQASVAEYLNHPEKALIARLINDTGIYVAASTFSVLLSFIVLAERRSHQQAVKLTQQVKALAAQLERTRIAREIHDSLGHTLTTLDVQLEIAQRLYSAHPDQVLQALNAAKDLASQSLADVRRALQSMREETFDLQQALMALVDRIKQGRSLDIRLRTNLPALSPHVGHQLYCIIQEGLTNVQKHAHATSVYLQSHTAEDSLTLELIDNGRGFDPQAASTGYGMRGMQERALILGAQLKIDSTPGQGTRITITIAL